MKALAYGMKSASILVFCLTLFLLGFPSTNQPAFSEERELVVLNWNDYVNPDLVKEFEKKFSARVKFAYYETDELKDSMLIATDGTGYDVVVSTGVSILPYLKKKWVAAISDTEVANLKHIDPRWCNAKPALKGYAVPYFWGTFGIAYREDLVPERIVSWKQLYRPAEALRKKIVMIKDSRECVGFALKALGYSFNSIDAKQYDEVERLLAAQKPFVKEYSYVSWKEDSFLVTGEVSMAMIYNGDALRLAKIDPRIVYVIPAEGTALWIDYMVVMEASKNKKLALDFINFLNEPQNAARNASYLCFATPNKEAEKYLSPDILQNRTIYPEEAVLSRSEYYEQLPPRIKQKRNQVFSAIAD